jgi:monofunctional biosynthetic peptidoglycan transglycosylase
LDYFNTLSRSARQYFQQPVAYRRLFKRLLLIASGFFVASSVLAVAALRFVPAPSSAFMLHRHIDDLVENRAYQRIDYQWVKREAISQYAYQAVIAAEDQRFYQHYGFDFTEINNAVDSYFEGGRLRGASTISQQVAKNLFLSPSKSLWRKGFEIWFTALIELLWDKQRILEMYLNIAEFGDHLFGIEAASRYYFHTAAQRLSASQAALLAATLPNPIKLKADEPTAYLHKRQAWILRQMRLLN